MINGKYDLTHDLYCTSFKFVTILKQFPIRKHFDSHIIIKYVRLKCMNQLLTFRLYFNIRYLYIADLNR